MSAVCDNPLAIVKDPVGSKVPATFPSITKEPVALFSFSLNWLITSFSIKCDHTYLGVIFLMAVVAASTTGDSFTAILLGIPGANSAAAGTFTSLVAGGDVDLGDATSDTITATGRFDSDLVPSTDGARDLGASSLEWKDLYIDGVAYIDSLQADQLGAALDANSQAITNINVDSGAIDGTTIGTASPALISGSHMSASGVLQVGGAVTVNDNITSFRS